MHIRCCPRRPRASCAWRRRGSSDSDRLRAPVSPKFAALPLSPPDRFRIRRSGSRSRYRSEEARMPPREIAGVGSRSANFSWPRHGLLSNADRGFLRTAAEPAVRRRHRSPSVSGYFRDTAFPREAPRPAERAGKQPIRATASRAALPTTVAPIAARRRRRPQSKEPG